MDWFLAWNILTFHFRTLKNAILVNFSSNWFYCDFRMTYLHSRIFLNCQVKSSFEDSFFKTSKRLHTKRYISTAMRACILNLKWWWFMKRGHHPQWSHDIIVLSQIKKVISLFFHDLWLPNSTRWWLVPSILHRATITLLRLVKKEPPILTFL